MEKELLFYGHICQVEALRMSGEGANSYQEHLAQGLQFYLVKIRRKYPQSNQLREQSS